MTRLPTTHSDDTTRPDASTSRPVFEASTRRLVLAWAAALATSMPWSGLAIGGEGSAASVLKYPLVLMALVLAYSARPQGSPWPRALKALAIYAGVSVVGAWLGPNFGVSLVRSARFSVLLLVSAWVIAVLDSRRLLLVYARLATVFVGSSLVALVAGFNPLRSGRLYGFLPPTHPNNIGAIAGIALIIVLIPWARGERPLRWQNTSLALLAAALVLSGSRTSLLATAFGVTIALVQRSARGRGVPILYCGALLVAVNLLFGNPLHSLYTRESARGADFIDFTFTGRSSRWAAAIQAEKSLAQKAFGSGLAVKTVPSRLGYIREEPLDGSWASAYAQAGFLGLGALAAALALLLVDGKDKVRRFRDPLFAGVVGFIILHSIFESSLNDVSVVLPALVALGARWSSATSSDPVDRSEEQQGNAERA